MNFRAIAVVLGLLLAGGCVSLDGSDYVDLTKPRPKPVYEDPAWMTYETTAPAAKLEPAAPIRRVAPEVKPVPEPQVKPEPKKAPAKSVAVDPIAKSSTLTAKEVQQALLNAGYYDGKIDGKIGPKSQAAIKKFQTDQGLKVDGVVGGKTSVALEAFLKQGKSVIEPPVFDSLETTDSDQYGEAKESDTSYDSFDSYDYGDQ